MIVAVCPACGYPTIGPDLCAFCRDVVMLTDGRDVRAESIADRRYVVDQLVEMRNDLKDDNRYSCAPEAREPRQLPARADPCFQLSGRIQRRN